MNKIVFSLCLVIFIACSKDEELDQPGPVPPVVSDSLGLWKKYSTGSTAAIWDIVFTSPARGFLCDQEGIRRSLDSGKTWTQILTKSNAYYTLQFLDPQHGFCIGTELARTIDGGNSWTVKPLPSRAIDINFNSPSNGLLATEIGLYRTVDSGSTWTMIRQDMWTALYFTDALNGWGATSRPGTIYKTTDGGLTWAAQPTPQTYTIHTLFFVGLRGWTVTDGPLLTTTNGGQLWQARSAPASAFDLQFVDHSTGYMTASGEVLKSTDAGITWKTDARIAGKRLVELFFTDPQHGWAAGEGGVVLRYKAP